jgi:hypothetical protein
MFKQAFPAVEAENWPQQSAFKFYFDASIIFLLLQACKGGQNIYQR